MRWRRAAMLTIVGAIVVSAAGCAHDLGIGDAYSTADAASDTGWVAGRVDLEGRGLTYVRHPDGTLSTFGQTSDTVAAVNASGFVIGNGYVETQAGSTAAPWFWSAAYGRQPFLSVGGSSTTVTDVNDGGVIVGRVTWSTVGTGPALWRSPTAPPQVLPQLPGTHASALAMSVNERGDVAGVMAMEDGYDEAVWWDAAAGHALRLLDRRGAERVLAITIADDGAVAGTLRYADGSVVSGVWTPGSGAFEPLSAPGPITIEDITREGDVVGAVLIDGFRRAARWEADTRRYVELGGLGGTESWVSDADSRTTIVGTAIAPDGRHRATRFEG